MSHQNKMYIKMKSKKRLFEGQNRGMDMYYDDEHNYKEKEWKDRKIKKILVMAILVLILLLAVVIALFSYHAKKDGTGSGVIPTILEQETQAAEVTFTESQLEDIFEISELSTATYTYNSIVSAYAEDGITVRYHVSYEGTVKVGVDFDRILMEIDNENKIITLTLPEAEVLDTNIDAGTMDYIFTDKKYNTETVTQEAYHLSCSDLQRKIENEEQLYVTAKENAVAAVEALIKPWVEQVDADYTVSIH